ncbi:uncharacterized protein LOC132304931 [Cornus florida]|uniref:uncharacterized protein LOC132304931 n=1 Tax=Cornus florida TaxID=4283 RepID=UPI0028A1E533|nr:uncharacterized protein LOC132304931 [Cornus florida]
MWDSLQAAHEGNKVIKENKIQLFKVQYKVYKIEERETVAEYMFRINDLVNNMRALDKDLSEVKIDELQASLTTYEMRIGVPVVHRREAALKAKEVVEKTEKKSEDDLKEDKIAYLTKKFRKFKFKNKNQLQNVTCYGCSKFGHVVSNYPNSKGQSQKKNEGGNYKGRFDRKALISDWDAASEEEKSEETQDEFLFMAILEAPQTLVQVEEDNDTEIEEILEECERLAVKCDQEKGQIKRLSSELLKSKQILPKHFKLKLSMLCSVSLIYQSLLKSQVNTQWSTKKYKEELSLILEERSLKMAEIWKQSTKQIGKTGIGYVCDSATKINQTHSIFVKATTGEVYARDNQKAKIISIGTINKSKELPEIHEVLLTEGLKHNLLSVSQLCDNGKEVCFNKEKCSVVDLRSNSMYRSSGNVYTVIEETQNTQCNLITCDEAKLWYKRLGYLHSRNLSKLLKLKAVKGFEQYCDDKGIKKEFSAVATLQ